MEVKVHMSQNEAGAQFDVGKCFHSHSQNPYFSPVFTHATSSTTIFDFIYSKVFEEMFCRNLKDLKGCYVRV